MSLVLTAALAAASAALPYCSWDRPGVDPFMGDVVAAVDRYVDIPSEVRVRLKARMAARRYDEIATIRRDAIVGRHAYGADIRDMHFGTGRVCRTVSRQQWSDAHQERGLVYCESGHCILVPTVCRNVSRITRRPAPQAAAGGGAGSGGAPAAGAAETLPAIAWMAEPPAATGLDAPVSTAPRAGDPVDPDNAEPAGHVLAAPGWARDASPGSPAGPASAPVPWLARTAPGDPDSREKIGRPRTTTDSPPRVPFDDPRPRFDPRLPDPPVSSVPEPSATGLLGLGLGLLGLGRRRRRRSGCRPLDCGCRGPQHASDGAGHLADLPAGRHRPVAVAGA